MKYRFFLQWDPVELSKSLKIRLEDVSKLEALRYEIPEGYFISS
tara:strand:+ start:276 stop:407 length:132 start_codon:yes stop_codon:yes gene_type:complete